MFYPCKERISHAKRDFEFELPTIEEYFIVHSKWGGFVKDAWHDGSNHEQCKYYVTIEHGIRSVELEYFTGLASAIKKKEDLVGPLYSLACDAEAGEMCMDDFQAEFGYGDMKVSKFLALYNACQEQLQKFRSLCIGKTPSEVREAISETFNY